MLSRRLCHVVCEVRLICTFGREASVLSGIPCHTREECESRRTLSNAADIQVSLEGQYSTDFSLTANGPDTLQMDFCNHVPHTKEGPRRLESCQCRLFQGQGEFGVACCETYHGCLYSPPKRFSAAFQLTTSQMALKYSAFLFWYWR